MAFDPDAALGLPTATAKPVASAKVGFDPDAALGIKPVEPGGLRAAAMRVAGGTIKGAGQLAADFIPGVSSDNALIQRGQEIITANPTAIGGLRDIVDKPGKFVAESVGNAGASLGTMVAMRGLGSAITAAAPLTGVAAPVTAGVGQLISWGGPIAAAALPSYSGIRDTQQEANPEEAGSLTSKLLAAGGAATVGAIEQKFGGEALAGTLMSAAGRKTLAEGSKQTLLKTVAKEGTKAAVGEGLEEGLQNPIEQLTGYQNPLTPQSLEQTATGMAMGAVGGGVMGGGMAPIVRQVANTTDPRVDEVQAKALAKITGAPVTDVSNGIATLTLEDGATFSVPVNRLTEHFASGGTLEALRPATSPAGLPPAGSPPPSLSDSPMAGEVAPWSQTRTEWAATQPATPDLAQRHYTSVVEALMTRQPVPDTVLAEYPELTARLTEQNSALAAQADLTPAQRQAETEAMYRDLFDEAQRREEWARLLPDRPVTEQTSALATQTDLTPAQAQAERDAAYRDLFDEALRRDAQRQGLEEGPLPPSAPTPLAVSRLVELEQKAQGVLTSAGGTTSTTLTPLEIAEYQRLKAETSPADAQAIAQYQQDVAARDMLLQKRDGAPGLTTQSESGEQTVVPAKPPQALSQAEQVELSRLTEATKTPPINPYITDSRPLAIGLPAAQAEVLYAQKSREGDEGGGASQGAQGSGAGPVRVRGTAQSGMAAEGRAASGETVTQLQGVADRQARMVEQEPASVEPLTAPRLTAALEKEFGKGAITALIRKGKVQIVESPTEIPGGEKLSGDSQKRILGAYRAKQGKIYLAAGNLSRASVANVFKHEVVHALLREDATFMARREALLKDFNKLAAEDASVQEAFAKVPANTSEAVKIEEALAYWVQNPDNHNHSLFKRIVAAVKAALRRLGIPTTAMTATDFSVLIAEGTQRFIAQGQATEGALDQTLFSQATAAHSAARSNVLANLKEIASEKLTETSPFILRIAPLQTLVQTLGRKIPQIGRLSRQFDEANHVATSIIEDGKGNYDAVKGLTRKDKSLDKFNDAANLSSFYRMTPWKSMDEQSWAPSKEGLSREDKLKAAEVKWKDAGMDKATGKSFIAAYLEAAKAYNALSPQVQEQYQKMVRHMKHIRDRERTNVLATIEAATANNPTLREAMMARFNTTFNNISGAYWQLSRTGDYRLEYVDLNGARVVEHFNSRAERRLAVEALVNDGVDPAGVKTGFAEKRTRGQVAIPNELMQQLTQSIVANQTAGLDPNADPEAFTAASQSAQDVINDMNQIWLRWQPETSALKNAVQRRNVKGYNRDALRSYLDYVQRHANSIAWTEQGRKIEDNLTGLAAEIKEERNAGQDVDLKTMVLNDLRARVQAVREANVGAVASTLGRLGTAYYMTSPSIALVQMTQLPILTLPKLGVMYDAPAKAAAALYRGIKASFSKKFSRDALFADDAVNALFNMTRDVVNEGNRDKPEVAGKALGERVFSNARIAQLFKRLTPEQQQLFILREALARNLLDISATHEAYAITQGKNPDAAWRKAFDLAMTPMRLSEQASRKAAILATMEMAQAQGKGYEEIMTDVTEVVNDTLYSYAKTNKPVFMQGGMGRVLGMFQWYRIMTAFRLALLFKRSIVAESPATRTAAQKELIGIMGTTAALAGSLGLPLSNLVFAALDALADDDEPRDSELEFRNLLQQGLGEKLGNIAAYGLPAAVGMHLTRRVGMGDMFGSNATPPPGTAGKDLAAWWAANQLGPAFSIGQSWVQGYDEIVNKGELMRGLETAMPKPLKDGLKALRVAASGELLSPSGKRLLGPEKITPDMVPMLALGFTPVEAAKVSENNMSRAIVGAQLSARRGRLIADAADALQGDGDIDAAKEAIGRFNTKMPAFAIRGGEIRTALIRSIKNERGVVGRREQRINSVYGVPSVE